MGWGRGGGGGAGKMRQMAAHCLVGRQGDAEAVSDSAERPLALQLWSPVHNPTKLAATEAGEKKRGSLVTLDVQEFSVPRGKKTNCKQATTAAAVAVVIVVFLILPRTPVISPFWSHPVRHLRRLLSSPDL